MPRKSVRCVQLSRLHNLPIGSEEIVVWIRWAGETVPIAYWLCKEGDGTIFVVPCNGPKVFYEIENFGSGICHDRIYLKDPKGGEDAILGGVLPGQRVVS